MCVIVMAEYYYEKTEANVVQHLISDLSSTEKQSNINSFTLLIQWQHNIQNGNV